MNRVVERGAPGAEEHLRVAETLCDALRAGDDEAVMALRAPNSTKWHNTDGEAKPATSEIGALYAALDDVYVVIDRILPTPSGFSLQVEIGGHAKRTGTPFVMRSCVVADVVGGLITATAEYIDSAPFQALYGDAPH